MMSRISQTVVTLLMVATCALAPTAVVAQQSEPEQTAEPSSEDEIYDAYFMSPEHRQEIYEQNRKSSTRAILWTALFPGLGNIYAEQYLLAGMAIVFMTFAGTFVGYGLSTRQPKIITLGAITAAIAYGGGGVTSVIGVSQFNAKLRRGLKVDRAQRVREVWSPMVTLRFR